MVTGTLVLGHVVVSYSVTIGEMSRKKFLKKGNGS
jgi:hypothetical protein